MEECCVAVSFKQLSGQGGRGSGNPGVNDLKSGKAETRFTRASSNSKQTLGNRDFLQGELLVGESQNCQQLQVVRGAPGMIEFSLLLGGLLVA